VYSSLEPIVRTAFRNHSPFAVPYRTALAFQKISWCHSKALKGTYSQNNLCSTSRLSLQRGRDQSTLTVSRADMRHKMAAYREEQRDILLLESCVDFHPINAALNNHIRVASFVRDAAFVAVLIQIYSGNTYDESPGSDSCLTCQGRYLRLHAKGTPIITLPVRQRIQEILTPKKWPSKLVPPAYGTMGMRYLLAIFMTFTTSSVEFG
jgi:hypothetical protein